MESETVAVDVRELRTVLDELVRNAKDLPALMPAVAETLVAAVHEEFATEGRGKWPPLAPATIAARRGGGGGAKILQDTGVFAGSITPAFGADYAEAFTSVPYAIFHTSDKPRRVIPLRNPFDIDEGAVLEEVVAMIQRALVP